MALSLIWGQALQPALLQTSLDHGGGRLYGGPYTMDVSQGGVGGIQSAGGVVSMQSGYAGGLNEPPEAVADSFGIMMTVGQSLNLRTDRLLGNDIDPEKNTFHLVHIPASSENGGTIAYDGEVIAYTRPDSGGDSDSFIYTVTDDYGIEVKGLVTLTFGHIITFPQITEKTFGDPPFTLSASASSGLPVVFSLLSGPATLSGDTMTLTGAGTVTLRASQAGDATYPPANDFDQTFIVSKAQQTIFFPVITDRTSGDPPFELTGSASSGLPLSFSVVSGAATLSGSTVTLTGGGGVVVRASQGGGPNHESAEDVERSFMVSSDRTLNGRVTLFGDGQTPVPAAFVRVNVDGEVHETQTDQNGYYQLNLPARDNYALRAGRTADTKANRGVDVVDIIALRKHILNREKLSSAMSWLAADTNRDSSIDVVDIVGIRKVILNRISFYSADANGKQDDIFRFTKLSFKDVEATQSFAKLGEALVIDYDGVTGDLNNVDFAAVKLGDANGDWKFSADTGSPLNAIHERAADPHALHEPLLVLGEAWSDSEGDLYVPVIGLTKEALMGVQYELAWDHRMLSLKGVISNSLPGFVMGVHTYDQEGRASLAWDDATLAGIDIDENEPMMVWRFGRVAEGGTGLSLERALMVGQQEGLGRMPSAALYLRPDDRSRAALRGVIKAIDFHGHQIHLWVDTRGAQHWQLESASRLEPSKWSRLKILGGNERWQQLELPHNEGMHFLRLLPLIGTDR
ncbi:Ig-like domain-containing protein [Verrucomicrobia bacterium]|nr:Ig-like domain-containing protein [Verrucomicrobiota bacterium]